MSVAVTVRDVPDDVRDELAARAARSGQSLQEYLRMLLQETASRPTINDYVARVRTRVNVAGAAVGASTILVARDTDRR